MTLARIRIGLVALATSFGGAAFGATELPADASAIALAMAGKRIVVLGEVHDNAAQHALRLAALRELLQGGARPAIAFEQFDRERQPDIDRARRERPRDAAHLVAQAKAPGGWNWDYYTPFVQLALDHDLPIVAANLSRADAMRIATGAVPADAVAVPDAVMRAHERAIEAGHCDLLPPSALPGMANAQVARDRAMADVLRASAERGVVLLAGNGHARVDIGAPFWLSPTDRAASVAVAFLEAPVRDDANGGPASFDAFVVTAAAEREDPCVALRRHPRMGK